MRTALGLSALAGALWLAASPAAAQWQPDGFGVCTAGNQQSEPVCLPDGAGGAILAWSDHRDGASDIYVQRVSAAGVPGWAPDGVPLCTAAEDQQDPRIVADGSGGAIVVWRDLRDDSAGDVYARRVTAAGVPQWAADGVAVCTATGAQISQVIASDGAGGVIVAWRDRRNSTDYDIYARRVDASGASLWTADGVALAAFAGDQTIPEILPDGAGGAFVAWFDRRSSPDADVYAQRVDAAGAAQWTPGGVAVCATTGVQRTPALVLDGSGGVIVVWWDQRNGSDFDIYARRVDAAGTPQWQDNGVALCTAAGDQQSARTISDGVGGAIVAWDDFRSGTDWDVYARRVGAGGVPGWTADGVPVCTAPSDQHDVVIVPDGSGGAIFSWSDSRDGDFDIYAQRADASGNPQWSMQGTPLCTAVGEQIAPAVAPDGGGGAIVAWIDGRDALQDDIYAQHIFAAGGFVTATQGVPVRGRLALSSNFPNPFSSATSMVLELEADAGVVVELYDVMGRRIREVQRLDLSAGSHSLTLNDVDGAGQPLANGIYFYRVTSNGTTLSRKLVLSR